MIERLDHLAATGLAPFIRPRGIVLNVVLHSLFADRSEFMGCEMDPHEAVAAEDLKAFVLDLRERGFAFTRPSELMSGNLRESGRYACLTFDDGYANNLRVLPLMEKYGLQATFFVASGNVVSGNAFWWDVVYRELRRRNWHPARIREEQRRLRTLACAEIPWLLAKEFGPQSLYPVGELDRPLSPGELRALAERCDVDIGNHTRDHACLTGCSLVEATSQIEGCQRDIEEMTGRRPRSIAYPYGNFGSAVSQMCRRLGLKLGLTTDEGTVKLRDICQGADLLRLPRVSLPRVTLDGRTEVGGQVERALVGAPFASAARWLRHSLA